MSVWKLLLIQKTCVILMHSVSTKMVHLNVRVFLATKLLTVPASVSILLAYECAHSACQQELWNDYYKKQFSYHVLSCGQL